MINAVFAVERGGVADNGIAIGGIYENAVPVVEGFVDVMLAFTAFLRTSPAAPSL